MKALLKKDLFCLRNFASQYLIMVAFIIVFSIFMDTGGMVSGFVIVFGANFVLSLFSLDEKYKWDVYCITMPFARKDIVKARYIVSALLIGSLTVVSLLVGIINDIVRGQPENLPISIAITLALSFIGYLSLSILMPITYRFGSEKSRFAIIIAYLAVAGSFVGLIYGFFTVFENASTGALFGLLAVLMAFAAIIMLVSYRLSQKYLRVREF